MSLLKLKSKTDLCNSCGTCCTNTVPMMYIEFAYIIQGLTPGEIKEKLSAQPQQTEETYCLFLDEQKRCEIYDRRPYVCRVFGKTEQSKIIKDLESEKIIDSSKTCVLLYDDISEAVGIKIVGLNNTLPIPEEYRGLTEKTFQQWSEIVFTPTQL